MLPCGQGPGAPRTRSALTGGKMSPKAALDFLREALADKRGSVIAADARNGRDRLGLDSYDQDEVLEPTRRELRGTCLVQRRRRRLGMRSR